MRFSTDTLHALTKTPHRAIVLLCAAYLAFLLTFRPATPFEWDEVQYQRALDRYDVAAHSPHPPGAPVYVAAARVLRVLVRDPQLATQLLTCLMAVGALALLYALVLALGGDRREGLLAAGALAVIPGFAFHANVGLTDVPAATCTLAVLLAAILAIDVPRRIPWLGVVAAFAVGLRPQILLAVLLAGVWAIVTAVRARHLGAVARAFAWGSGLSVVIWGTAILITGPARFLTAWQHHTHWMATAEFGARLPAARLTSIVRYWFVSPFGTWELAAVFWLVVLAGAVRLLTAGSRQALVLVLGASVPYIVAGLFTFNMLSAVRYELPGLAVLAALAGTAVAWRPRAARVAVTAAIALWGVASVIWGMRVYTLRREPAPVWATLQWIRTNLDPERTLVVSDGSARPHVEYVLGRAAFHVADWAPGCIYPGQDPGGESIVLMTRLPVPGWDVQFARDWGSRRLLQLAFWRYGSFAAQRPAPPDSTAPAFSPAWQIERDTYVLWGVGQVRLPDTAEPATAALCPLNAPVTVVSAAAGRETVAAGECRYVPMRPGSEGGLFVIAPENLHAVLRAVRFEPVAAAAAATPAARDAGTVAPEFVRLLAEHDAPFPRAVAPSPGPLVVLPSAAILRTPAPTPVPAPPLYVLPVARAAGFYGAQWRTELAMSNSSDATATVTFELLAAGKDNSAPRRAAVVLAPGEKRPVADALGELFGADGTGALRVTRGSAAVTVQARTYDSAAKAPRGRFLDGVEEAAAFAAGRTALLSGLGHDPTGSNRTRTNLGLLNVTAVAIEVEAVVLGKDGGRVGSTRLRLGPHSFTQVDDLFRVAGATGPVAGSARVTTATPSGAFLAYASVVRRDPPSATYVLPKPVRGRAARSADDGGAPAATPAPPSSSTASPAGASAPSSPH